MKFFTLVCGLVGLMGGLMRAEETKAPQVWVNGSVAQRFDYGLEFMMETEQRLSAEKRCYERYEVAPQLIWHYSPRYDFSMGYEENRQWDEEGGETAGHEAFASTTLKWASKDWRLTSRQRVQYGVDAEEETVGVFRQRTELSHEIPRLPWRLRPYLADEWVYDLENGNGLMENRLQLGLRYPINRAWKVEVYGMRLDQWDARGKQTTTPVAGISVSANF